MQFLQKRNARQKFTIHFTILNVSPLPNSKSLFYVSYSRGKKWNNETMRVLGRQGIAEFNQSFDIPKLSLFKSKNGIGFKKKYIVFKVYETSREKSIGKCKLNLGEICDIGTESSVEVEKEIPLLLWKRNEVYLKVKFNIELIKRTLNQFGEDILTDQTTMTDMSLDEEDTVDSADEDNSSDKRESSFGLPIRNPIPKIQTKINSNLDPNPRVSPLVTVQGKTDISGKSDSNSSNSSMNLDGDENFASVRVRARGGSVLLHKKPNGNSNIVQDIFPDKNDSKFSNDTKSLRAKRSMQSGRDRRKENHSISMEGDERSFLDNIGEELDQARGNKRSNLFDSLKLDEYENNLDKISVNPTRKENISSSIHSSPQSPTHLRSLYKKLESEETFRRHNVLINTMIKGVKREYPQGINISAAIILKVLNHWDVFSMGTDSILGSIISSIEEVVSQSTDINVLAYWFSACTTMLNVLQKNSYQINYTGENDIFENMKSIIANPKLELNNIKEEIRKNILHDEEEDDFSFSNPSTLFQKELKLLSANIYCKFVNQVKQMIEGILKSALFESSALGHHPKNTITQVLDILQLVEKTFEDNHIFPEFFSIFFEQIFYYIDAYGLNLLMDRQKRLVSMNNGLALKMNLTQLENWSKYSEYCPNAFNQLAKLRQASDIIIMQKTNLVSESTRKDVCPNLNVNQIRTLLILYQPDMFDSTPVPDSVLRSIPHGKSDEKINCEEDTIFIPSFHYYENNVHVPVFQSVDAPIEITLEEGFEFLKSNR